MPSLVQAVAAGGGGSCLYYGPPTQGFGACYALPAGADPATACQTKTLRPVACPAVGVVVQCAAGRTRGGTMRVAIAYIVSF